MGESADIDRLHGWYVLIFDFLVKSLDLETKRFSLLQYEVRTSLHTGTKEIPSYPLVSQTQISVSVYVSIYGYDTVYDIRYISITILLIILLYITVYYISYYCISIRCCVRIRILCPGYRYRYFCIRCAIIKYFFYILAPKL